MNDHVTTLRPVASGTVRITTGRVRLEADLCVPEGAHGLVVFVHGSGSSRLSPRNRQVASRMNAAGLGTLLTDLLTRDEESVDLDTGALRFDIALLAQRLIGIIDWLQSNEATAGLSLSLFGASTGAAAALVAASRRAVAVRSIVSRGGRPDLAAHALGEVEAPTLLIVGGEDAQVILHNRRAMALLGGEKELVIIPGATHLFEEPGALDTVSTLARDWVLRHLPARGEVAC
ncbi:dienelactone hydrolase family protein [Ideonella sp. YS5]|uniref:dienelactone hydrolase family protein n=1 Tax=Ideonella sp. YS5 TaxID=3453714 RepID=UPI003EE97766